MKMDDARRALVVAGASASLSGRATGTALELPEDLAEPDLHLWIERHRRR